VFDALLNVQPDQPDEEVEASIAGLIEELESWLAGRATPSGLSLKAVLNRLELDASERSTCR
jgi:hypothetical protein